MATVHFKIEVHFSDDCDQQTRQQTDNLMRQIKDSMIDSLNAAGIEVQVTDTNDTNEDSERTDADLLSRGGVFL